MPPESSVPAGGILRWGAVFYLVLAVCAILWLGLRDGAISASPFLRSETWARDLGLGIAAGALLVGGWQLGVIFLPTARRLEKVMAATIGPLGTSEALVLALLSGFAEELLFRGAVLSQWGLLPATVLFTLLHMGPGREFRLWTLFALIAALLLGGLVLWRGTLLAAVVAHVGVNAVGLLRLGKLTDAPGQNST